MADILVKKKKRTLAIYVYETVSATLKEKIL